MKTIKDNTGDRNTGDWNTGDWNTGDCNTGDCNTGNFNTGNWNTGNWNAGDWNTGYFNTNTPDQVDIFDVLVKKSAWDSCDKPSFIYFNLTEWVAMSEMTDKEKEDNPSYRNAGGYLKVLDYKKEFRNSYNKATKEDKKKIFNIPNFDAVKFLEISGIDVYLDSEQECKKQALIDKANELLEQAKKM